MSDELIASVAVGRKHIQKEIDLCKEYFDKVGYTVTQYSVIEKSYRGSVTLVKGSIEVKSPDDYKYKYTLEVPVSETGNSDIVFESMLTSFLPDLETTLSR